MKQALKNIARFIKIPEIIRYASFSKEFAKLKKQSNKNKRLDLKLKNIYPCIHDKTNQTYFDRHYVYHTSWAVRILKKTNPEFHVDISSSLYFSAISSAFLPIKFYDYRPAKLELDNLYTESANLVNLHFKDKSINSLSCMHVVEHIGLGRYGDPIDIDGDLKAINELQRVVSHNGNLLFVVPIGKPKIMFNAHRIYSYNQIIDYFPELELEEFSLIPEDENDGGIIKNPNKELLNKQSYGCGCFWFKRK